MSNVSLLPDPMIPRNVYLCIFCMCFSWMNAFHFSASVPQSHEKIAFSNLAILDSCFKMKKFENL